MAGTTAASAGTRFETVPPPPLPAAEGPAPVAASYVELRLTIPIAPLRAGLERALPRELRPPGRVDTARADPLDSESPLESPEHGEEAEREWKGRPVRWRGLLRRSPFEVAVHADSLVVTSAFAWSVEPLERGLDDARCGSAGAPLGGSVGCESLLGWSDDWSLESRCRATPTRFATNCKLSPPGLEFTHRVNAQLDASLTSRLPARVDSVVRAFTDQSATLRAALRRLARPVMIGDSAAWFLWNVSAARVDPPRGAGSSILTHVVFEAHPSIVPSPPVPDETPLPAPLVRLSGTGMRVPFDCWVDFADIARDLEGLSPDAAGGGAAALRTVAGRVTGGGNRLAVALDLDGPVTGTAWLVGTLAVEPTRFVLSCPDLEWSPESRRALQSAAGAGGWRDLRARLETMRNAVRRRLERPLGDCIASWDKSIRDALQPDLELPTVQGGIYQREVGSIFCTDRAIGVRVVALGRAQVITEAPGRDAPR